MPVRARDNIMKLKILTLETKCDFVLIIFFILSIIKNVEIYRRLYQQRVIITIVLPLTRYFGYLSKYYMQ